MRANAFLLALARLLMSSLFIWDGIGQLNNPPGTLRYFTSVHVPVPDVAVWVSIAIHLYFIVTGLLGTEIPGALAGLWRGAIYRVLLVLIGALAVVDLERRGSGYNSTAPAHP